MQVDYAFLCDFAHVENKLTAVGIGIDSIQAAQLPAIHPQLFAVLGLRFTAEDTTLAMRCEMRMQGPDGADVIPPIATTIDLPRPDDDSAYRTRRIVNGMYGLRFERFGDYRMSWLVDGVVVHAARLRVVESAPGLRSR